MISMITNEQFCARLIYMALKRKSFYSNSFPKNCLYINEGGVLSADCIGMIKSLINDPEAYKRTSPVGYYVKPGTVIPDTTEKGILNLGTSISANFNKLTEGEYLYMSGHAGAYVGEFKDDSGTVNVIECTPAFGGGITTSYVSSTGTRYNHKGGYSLGKWEQHCKLTKYIDYESDEKIMKWESNKKWYLKDEKGNFLTGWQKFEDDWYYMDHITGEMLTGFQQLKWSKGYDIFYFDKEGKMATGTKTINGKSYKFDSNGALQI